MQNSQRKPSPKLRDRVKSDPQHALTKAYEGARSTSFNKHEIDDGVMDSIVKMLESDDEFEGDKGEFNARLYMSARYRTRDHAGEERRLREQMDGIDPFSMPSQDLWDLEAGDAEKRMKLLIKQIMEFVSSDSEGLSILEAELNWDHLKVLERAKLLGLPYDYYRSRKCRLFERIRREFPHVNLVGEGGE